MSTKVVNAFGELVEPVRMSGIWGGEQRWYISMGLPGYNSPANNRRGYKTAALALAAIRHYSRGGRLWPTMTPAEFNAVRSSR